MANEVTAEARVGFVIPSCEGGTKLQRLIRALDREYDTPPIAVHHDFSQGQLDRGAFGDNVLWVEDWVRTKWASWSVIEGTLKAFRLIYEQAEAEWIFLVSPSDYPVAPGRKVRRELAGVGFDAYLDARQLTGDQPGSAAMTGPLNHKLDHFDKAADRAIKRRFYCSPQWWVPIVRFKPHLRVGKWTYRPPFDGSHPFHHGIGCYYGDHWFAGNRRAVAALLAPSPLNQALQRHYRNRTLPEESYYTTLLANTPDIRICRDNRRFAEWNGGGARPMTLTHAQLPEMLGSNAFFARKFADNPALLDDIDAWLTATKPEFQFPVVAIGEGGS